MEEYPWKFKKGRIPWNKGKKGVQICSEETRKKMSKSRTGKIFTEKHKRNIGLAQLKEKHHNWKGGRVYHRGYVLILKPEHPHCNQTGYVYEHRLVMEKFLKRYLLPNEVVHHKNDIKDDNRIENLELFKNKSEHIAFHNKLKVAV